jgi:hypothetical protein
MQPHCPAMPRMPGIADFTAIPNMGVVLLTCIIQNATIKGKKTPRSSPLQRRKRIAEMSAIARDSATCFDIIAGPLDYFVPTGIL